MTRRGRLLLSALAACAVVGVVCAGAGLFASSSATATAESSSQQFRYVVPQPGDTLWQVATRLDPQADPRDVIYEIEQLNNLQSSALQAYEAVAVPMRYADAPGVVGADEAGVKQP